MRYKLLRDNSKKRIREKTNITLFVFISFAAIFSVAIFCYLNFTNYGSDKTIALKKERNVVENVTKSVSFK